MEIVSAAIAVMVGIIAHVIITVKRVPMMDPKENPMPDAIINALLAELIAVGCWMLMHIDNYL